MRAPRPGYIYLDDTSHDGLPGFTGAEVVFTPELVLFWQPPATFSQWTPARFEVEGIAYTCAEQFMMASKARLFGDHGCLARIMATDDPRTHKALGRQVQGFDRASWEAVRLEIVIRGNLARFGQNPALADELLETGDRTLAEASPMDAIWGIGLRGDDPRALESTSWRGLNLLGQALMTVRDALRQGEITT